MMWLDAYERRCRLAPGLLALVPVAVTIVALGIRDAPVVSAAISILSLASGPKPNRLDRPAQGPRRAGIPLDEVGWTTNDRSLAYSSGTKRSCPAGCVAAGGRDSDEGPTLVPPG